MLIDTTLSAPLIFLIHLMADVSGANVGKIDISGHLVKAVMLR